MPEFTSTDLIVGIDYGSKLAGTTALAYLDQQQKISTIQSEKKKDADTFIQSFVRKQTSRLLIYIDAPLSLPGVYQHKAGCTNYFYRQCDLEVQAMSPMFLGGLTARAMKLNAELTGLHHSLFEAYPKLMAAELSLPELGYKKELSNLDKVLDQIEKRNRLKLADGITSWHEVDAILALLIGVKHKEGGGRVFGQPDEGQIYG